MKLPSLKVSLPIVFLCWCLAGVQTHGWVLLAYPAMWALVGLFFLGLHLLLRAPAANANISETVAAQAADSARAAPIKDDSPTDHQISASA